MENDTEHINIGGMPIDVKTELRRQAKRQGLTQTAYARNILIDTVTARSDGRLQPKGRTLPLSHRVGRPT